MYEDRLLCYILEETPSENTYQIELDNYLTVEGELLDMGYIKIVDLGDGMSNDTEL